MMTKKKQKAKDEQQKILIIKINLKLRENYPDEDFPHPMTIEDKALTK